ncbi:MAG: hypothetical protein WBU92_04150 [Candidatus Dormiibacterota bacterium]
MWSSPARRLLRPAAAAVVATSALILAGCASPATAARLALQGFLLDVHAHSVVYAYTLLTNSAESKTPFLPFFNGVNSSRADFRIEGCRVLNLNQVSCTVAVTPPGAPTRRVTVQMLEEGNAGDWLVAAPFTTKGADAILLFQ